MPSNPRMTVGELVAAFLESSGVHAAFGVISIHNMPILDAFGRRAAAASANGRPAPIRFVPGARRGRRGQHGRRLRPGFRRARRRRHEHRHRRRQCLRRDGRGAHRGYAGAAPDRADRGALSRPRARLHPRSARAAGHAQRSVEGGIPRAQCGDRARHAARGRPRCAHGAPRPGQRRDPDRHPVDARSTCRPRSRRCRSPCPGRAASELDALAERLARAKRPLLWLGGGARHAGARSNALSTSASAS